MTNSGLDFLPPPSRRLPHSVEAEMAYLGSILINQDAYERSADLLRPEHFALAEHRRIYVAYSAIVEAGGLADTITVKSSLENDGILREVGGASYLSKLQDGGVSVMNAVEYARLIRDQALRRALITAGEEVIERAYNGDPGEDAEAQIEAAERSLYELAGDPQESDLTPRQALSKKNLARYRADALHLIQRPPRKLLMGGWLHDGSKAFLVGSKKSGKSFLGLEISRAVAAGDSFLHWQGTGRPANVLYIDGEMGLELVRRRVAMLTDRGLSLGDLTILSYDELCPPPIETPAGRSWIARAAKETEAEMVVLDNFTVLTAESLKEDDTVKRINPLLSQLVTSGVGTLSILHTGHDQTRYAGSSVLGAITTSIIHLMRDETEEDSDECTGKLSWQAVREAEPGDPDYRSLQYAIGRGGVFMEQSSSRAKPKRTPTKPLHYWAVEQMKQLLDREGIVLPACDVRPLGIRGIRHAGLLLWLQRRRPSTERDGAVKIAHELIEHGWMASDGEWVWLV